MVFQNYGLALAGVAQWIEHGLLTKGLLVCFPVRAHAWVAVQIPIRGHARGNYTLIFLSLSLKIYKFINEHLRNVMDAI